MTSAIVAFVRKRKRATLPANISAVFGLRETDPTGAVQIRPLTLGERDQAIKEAEAYRGKPAGDLHREDQDEIRACAETTGVIVRAFLTPEGAQDVEVARAAVADARATLANAEASLAAAEAAAGAPAKDAPLVPVFPSSEWLREHLTTDQIGVLLNIHNAAKARLSPTRPTLTTDEELMAVSRAIAAEPDLEAPALALADASREYLSELVVLQAVKLCGALDRLKDLGAT